MTKEEYHVYKGEIKRISDNAFIETNWIAFLIEAVLFCIFWAIISYYFP